MKTEYDGPEAIPDCLGMKEYQFYSFKTIRKPRQEKIVVSIWYNNGRKKKLLNLTIQEKSIWEIHGKVEIQYE